ncbi:MAG: HlyC/CorC family transporter [Calditrichaeota bacterium]|nr:HlyC/CorC family transporter [Calditrichota bacterium]MCB9391097.1 HlyC/CorC family transporter [Calditrichota bacterium]
MEFIGLTLAALALSSYFSALEISFTTFDTIIMGGWKKAGKFGSSSVEFFATVPERYLFTTLVGNNLANVAYSSFLVIWAGQAGISETLLILLSPFAVIIIGEVIPKTIGLAFANRIVRIASPTLYAFYWLFAPFRLFIAPLEKVLRRRTGSGDHSAHAYDVLFRREIDSVLGRASREGTVTAKESEILERYLHAREVRARDIMTPRPLLVALPKTSTIAELIETVEDTRHSVIPIYDQTVDDIIGIVESKDLLVPRASLEELLRPALFVPESKLLVELIEQFKHGGAPAGIVVDEHGGTDGIITRKDLFRELVGPLSETDETRLHAIKRLARGKYLVSALADLSDIAEGTGWRPPDGDYATLSGLLAEHLGHIGKPGEEIVIDNVTIRILRASDRRVESCLLKLTEEGAQDDEF